MSLHVEMKKLTEEITASHKERDKEIKDRVADVAKMLGGFDQEQAKMAKEQQATFAADEKARLAEDKARLASFKKMMAGIDKTISELAKYTETFLADFQTKRLAEFKVSMAELDKELAELKKYTKTMLADHEKERSSEFKAMMERINKEIEAIEKSVALYLKEMDAAHAKMAKEQQATFAVDKKARLAADRNRLANFKLLMKGIDKEIGALNNRVELLQLETQKSLAGIRADHLGAMKTWLEKGKAPAPKQTSAMPAPKPAAAPHWEPKPVPPAPPAPKVEAKPFTPPAPKEEPKPFTPP
ncbi:MAG: hypothetical protein WCO14_05270, partial [bacterium]